MNEEFPEYALTPAGTFLEFGRFPVVGVVAQLVEHHNGIVGVWGSNPHGSTIGRK